MMDIFIKRGNSDTETDAYRGKTSGTHMENTICKPRST